MRELNPAVPEPLAALIHQLLAKKRRRPAAVGRRGGEAAAGDRGGAGRCAGRRSTRRRSRRRATAGGVRPDSGDGPAPEANPFADLDADATESRAGTAVRRQPRSRHGRSRRQVAVDGRRASRPCWRLVVGGVIIVIKNKDGTRDEDRGARRTRRSTIKGKDGKTLAQVGPEEAAGGRRPGPQGRGVGALASAASCRSTARIRTSRPRPTCRRSGSP